MQRAGRGLGAAVGPGPGHLVRLVGADLAGCVGCEVRCRIPGKQIKQRAQARREVMQGDPGGLLPVTAAHDDAQACHVAKAHPGQVDMDPASAIRGFGQGRGRGGSRDMAEDVSDFRASITELQAVLLGTESIDGFWSGASARSRPGSAA